jgi:myo-inositol-1(or 4)-monophosphatase
MTELLALAEAVAREAGALLLELAQTPRSGVGSKTSDTDMVSDADRLSEKLIVDRIASTRPDDEIVGEEGSHRAGSSGVRWTIDPLDGTTNFLFGIPQWSVSVACEDGDGLLAGAVFAPASGELFSAARGGKAMLNGSRINVSERADLSDALVGTGFSYFPEERAVQAAMLRRILPAVRDIRRPGSCALDLCWTAAGRYDAFYEVPTMPWDWKAGALIVGEAGGVVSELPAIGPGGPGIIAARRGLHDELLGVVLAARDLALEDLQEQSLGFGDGAS